jgi:NAD(P)-dependent dehydrogenase (short-subunit alcohol dehydrogenase family)
LKRRPDLVDHLPQHNSSASIINTALLALHYSKCDVRNWEERKAAFKLTVDKPHDGFVDNVIVNAGMSGDDPF